MMIRTTVTTLCMASLTVLSLAACQPADTTGETPDGEVSETPATDAPVTPDSDEIDGPGTPGASQDGLSVYTTVNVEDCELIRTDPESGGRTWACEGHAGIPLLAHDGDGRFDLDAGVQGGWAGIGPFNNLSETVEWRGLASAPYAIIYRLRSAAPEMPNASWLIVESIGTEDAPGCVVGRVDGATSNANVQARDYADRLARDFDCDNDQPAGVRG